MLQKHPRLHWRQSLCAQTELPINSMQVVHKPDSQLALIGTAPRMSITSNMMSVSAGGGPCANLQQERTQRAGRQCGAAAEHDELTVCADLWSPRFTQDHSGRGFDPGLVASCAGEDRNISPIALIVPFRRTTWGIAVSFSWKSCSRVPVAVLYSQSQKKQGCG